MRSGRKSEAQTPSPKKDRIKGSKVNPKGSASSTKSAKSIELSDSITTTLENKRDEYNSKHPNAKVTLATLKAVFRRGSGAFSSSHRPGMSRSGWAFARVNKFLLKKGGTKVKAAYVQDDDLMEKGGALYHLGGDMSKHLAPNGKPSNLTHEQWHLVRTPEFKAWFGDWENDPENASKVIDDNGEPLVLHRGNLVSQEELGYTFNLGQNFLKKKNANEFGFFFSNEIDIAKKYMLVDHFDEIRGGSITSVFIQSNKILDLLDFNLKIGQDNFVQGLIEKGVYFTDEYSYLQKKILDFNPDNYKYWGYNVFDYFDVFPELRNLFIKNGFNSVIFYEMSRKYSKYKVYVALNSNQIKLADGTNTTFDANNADIRYEEGGDLGQEITCVKCGWHWNTSDSDEFDKYICHRCGFDNRTFYDSDPIGEETFEDGGVFKLDEIALPDTYANIETLKRVLGNQGYEIVKSVKNKGIFETGGMVVGKSHQEADENGTGEKFKLKSTGQVVELEGGEAVIVGSAIDSEDTIRFNGEEKSPREIASYLNHAYGGVKFEKGGHITCGCSHKKYYHGGELPSAVVNSLNGGEAVITKKTMDSQDKYEYEGERLTPRQILSRINHRYGGVSFAKGGKLTKFTNNPINIASKMIYFVNNIIYA